MVIPAFNAEKFLRECLDSVENQTHKEWLCIIVDDGSQDRTASLVQEYCARDPRFRLISQTNQGLAGARNTGIRAATTPWVALLDSDDYYFPEAIAQFEQALAAYGQVANLGILGGHFCHKPEDRVQSTKMELVDIFLTTFGLQPGPPLCCSSVAIARRCFEEVGFYENVLCEDRDFWFRAAPAYKVCQIHATVSLYRRDQPSTMNDKLRATGEIALAQRRVFEKHRHHRSVLQRLAEEPGLKEAFERRYEVSYNLLTAAHALVNQSPAQASQCFVQAWRKAESGEREHLFLYLLDILPYPQQHPAEATLRYAHLSRQLAHSIPQEEKALIQRLRESSSDAYFRAAQLSGRASPLKSFRSALLGWLTNPGWSSTKSLGKTLLKLLLARSR